MSGRRGGQTCPVASARDPALRGRPQGPGLSGPSLGRGRTWACSFPKLTSRAECERMRALALARTCLPHGAVVVYLMSSDVPCLCPGCLVSSPLGKQAFQLSQGAGFLERSVSHDPTHLLRYRRSFKLKERTQQSRSVTTGITNPCRNRMVIMYSVQC